MGDLFSQKNLQYFFLGLALVVACFVGYLLFSPVPDTVYHYSQEGVGGCCKVCKIGQPCGSGCIPRMARCTLEYTCACPWRVEVQK